MLAGLFFHRGIEYIAVFLFLILYLLENLRRPVAVTGIADRMGNESLTTFLSTDSQMRSIFTMIFSPLVGLLADKISPGAGVMITALIIIIIYPLVKLRDDTGRIKKG